MNQKIQTQDNQNIQDQNIDPRIGNPFYKGGNESKKNTERTEENLNNSQSIDKNKILDKDIKITVEEETSLKEVNKDIKEDESIQEDEEIPLNEQLEEFLSRNLFLEPDLKQKILEADLTVQEEILPILSQMDEKQTDLFRKILEKNPHFFGDLENMAIRDALKKLVQREEQEHLSEIANAENELENMLNSL